MKAGVSGSVGVASGVGRASGGANISRGFGSSLSPEARFGAASSKFSSRGLSMFNKDAISSAPKSIFNINQGREAKPQFAVNKSLRSGKSIFDTTRSISPAVSTFSAPKNEFGVKLNINQAREVKSPVARVKALEPKKAMFDISKPVAPKEKLAPSIQKVEPRIAKPELKAKPTIHVSPFKDTVILWQNPDLQPRVKSEIKTKEVVGKNPAKNHEVYKSKPDGKSLVVESKTRSTITPKRIELKHVIQFFPTVSPDKLPAIRKDIKDAKKMIPTIVKARGVSYRNAVLEMAQVLAKKHEGSVQISPAVQTQSEIEPVTKVEASQLPMPQLKPVDTKVDNRKTGLRDKFEKPEDKSKKDENLYFMKDKKTNEKKANRVINAFMRLWGNKANDRQITGWDVIQEKGNSKDPSEVSELTRHQGLDKKLELFIETIRNFGEINDPESFVKTVREYSEDFSAVKLSKENDITDGTLGIDAMLVYGKPLNGVEAYVEEDGSSGELRAGPLSKRVNVQKNKSEKVLYEAQKQETQDTNLQAA